MSKPTLSAVGGKDVPETKDAREFYRRLEADVLARTIWGEARGEGLEGMRAVANVIINRVKIAELKNGFWWGNNIIQVCQKPYQFSCWNRSDPNFKKLQAVDETDIYFASALRIARRILINRLDDNTSGSTHYHAKSISPYWSRGEEPCAHIGSHTFYKLVGG